MSLLVFVNPRSRANRRDPGLLDRFSALVGRTGKVLAPQSLEELDREARSIAETRPTAIAIHGGDGTLHKTVAALIQAHGGRPLPPVAILTGGTMNVVASSLGIRAEPDRLLAQLVSDCQAGRAPETIERRCLKIADSFGFVFGNGLMANFLEEYYATDGYSARRAMWILGRTVLSAMANGSYARRIFRNFSGRVLVDGRELPWRTLTAVGAATVREVGLGFKLNHRADEDPERFSVLAIHAGALPLTRDLLSVHQGKGVAPERAWSGVASRLVIEPDGGACHYTIDGDLYQTRGPLEVAIGPALAFVKPRTI